MAHEPLSILVAAVNPEQLAPLTDGIRQMGYTVLEAINADQAQRLVSASSPSLLLLDTQLPGLGQLQESWPFAARVVAQTTPPLLFFGTPEDMQDVAAQRKLRAADFVSKQLPVAEILARVTLHLKLHTLARRLEAQDTTLAREVAARHRMDEALRASEVKYRSIFESTSNGLFLHRIIGTGDRARFVLHDVNQRGCELCGSSRADLLEGRFDVLAACRAPFSFSKAVGYYRLAATGLPQQYDWEFQRPDGSVIWGEVNLRRMRIGNEEFLLAIMRDVSSRVRLERQLAKQAAEYQAMLDNSPDVIVRYDRECRRLYANPAFERAVNAPAERVLGQSPEETWTSPRDLRPTGTYQRHLRQILDTQRPATWELSLAPNGTARVEYQIRGVPEFDAEGKICGVLTISRDISSLKQAQAALDESERRYREVFENASDGFYLIEVLGERRFRNLAVNPALLHATGWQRDDIVGRLVHETAIPSLAKVYVDRYQNCVSTGQPLQEEVTFSRHTGQQKVFESTIIPLRDVGGRIHRLVGIAHDITAQRELERALEERAREFRTLVENMPDAIFRYDAQGHCIYVNPIAARLVGSNTVAPAGTIPVDAMHLAERFGSHHCQCVRQVLGTGEELETSVHSRDSMGRLRTYLNRLVPELGAQGSVVGVLSILRDITEYKEHEAELEDSRKRLRELSEHRDAVLEAERKRIAQELHEELGQVLTALRLTISMLRVEYGETQPVLKEKSHAMTELVDRAIRSMREVVITLRPSVLDAGILAALEWLTQDFRKHTGLECRLVVDSRFELSRDRSLALFRIVQEALTNAVRHAHAKRAEVQIAARDKRWLVTVQDNGTGFEPGAPRSKKAFGLMGMQERAHTLMGTLTIASTPGSGTRIQLEFPFQVGDLPLDPL